MDYKIIDEKPIAKGTFGKVYSAVDKDGKEGLVVIKRIDCMSMQAAHKILCEVILLKLLKHNNIVNMVGVRVIDDLSTHSPTSPTTAVEIVFERMDGDLRKIMSFNKDLSPQHVKLFMYQILRAVMYMHSCGVLHRDLKPENILVNTNCLVKLADFGMSRAKTDDEVTCVGWTDYVATRWYRAPELVGCFYARYDFGVDMWAVGCIFAELLSPEKTALFRGRDSVDQMDKILEVLGMPNDETIKSIQNKKAREFIRRRKKKQRCWDGGDALRRCLPTASSVELDLLGGLLAFDPRDRLGAKEALAHPYFSELPPATDPTPSPGMLDEIAMSSMIRRNVIASLRAEQF